MPHPSVYSKSFVHNILNNNSLMICPWAIKIQHPQCHLPTMCKHCQAVANKASRTLTCIRRSICSQDRSFLMPLNLMLVRPSLEYAVQLWALVCRRDILELERVHVWYNQKFIIFVEQQLTVNQLWTSATALHQQWGVAAAPAIVQRDSPLYDKSL